MNFSNVLLTANPDRLAYVYNEKNYTINDIQKLSWIKVNALVEKNIKPQQRVALVADDSIDWIATFWALSIVGCCIILLHPSTNDDIIESLCKQHNINTVISDRQLPACGTVLSLESLNTTNNYHVTPYRYDAQMPFLCFSTSGTSGTPKLTVHTNNSVLYWGEIMTEFFKRNSLLPDNTMLCLAKFAGAWGFLNNLVGNMFVGPRSVIGVTPRDFKKVDVICEKFSVTSLIATPYFLEFLLKSKIEKFPSTLKNILTAGEPLLDLVASNFYKKFNTKVINCYGLSEAASVTSESDHHKSNSVGRPFAGVSIKIIDDQGNECDINTPGTLFVKSPAQTIGYLDDTEATNKLLVDGWVNTNDIVSVDNQGDIIFHGRANSFVKFKSQVISLLDIESTILEIPEVNDCVVVPSFNEIGVSELTAMIVVDKISNNNIKNVIQQALLTKLEKNYVSIKNINMVDQIPRTTSMKKIRALNVASTEVK